MTRLVLLASWLLAAVPGSAESDLAGAPSPPPSLVGTPWRWERTLLRDDSVDEPSAPASRSYIVEFGEQGRLSVRADCNRVLGTWTSEGSALTLAAGPSTMVQCPEGSLADAFLAQLDGVASYSFRDGDLVLDLQFDGGTMRLSPLATELAGTRWRVTGYQDGQQAVVGLLPGTRITAAFESDARVVGEAGCNRYQAPYDIDGDRVSVGPPAVTRMHCGEPEGVMEQERLFLVALQLAASRSLDGDRLELRSANGALAVTLIPAPPAEPDPE